MQKPDVSIERSEVDRWIGILKCPISGQGLQLLSQPDLELLNKHIREGNAYRVNGKVVPDTVEMALCNEESSYYFPIIEGILLLINNLAIITDKTNILQFKASADKDLVKNFYDREGWFTDEKGNYEDAVIYEDLRPVSAEYIKKCHDRVAQHLNNNGKFMLDAASGALQYDDYLQYSENYQYRVCVDFSFQALKEAQRKIGKKGIYVMADMCNMPFKDGVMDGFVSLNTIYHIPKEEQAKAVHELYRLLAKGGKGVVVYDWFKHSAWMNVSLLPFRGFEFLKNRVLGSISSIAGKGPLKKRLYFHAHTLAYLREHLPPFKLAVWRSVSVPFLRYYIHSSLGGKEILNWIYTQEEKDPEKCGEKGEYPMFIFQK